MTRNLWAKVSPRSSTVPPMPKWRPRQTVIDLYNERDQTRWYWRFLANVSAFMIMAG
jgi:hypothetical protein